MRLTNNLDLGAIKVHKQALAEIVASAVSQVEGVRLVENKVLNKLWNVLDQKVYPGVEVSINEANEVSFDVRVLVRYGLNIQFIASQIQEVIRSAVEKMVDINLKDINVSIHGIERGEA